MGYFKTVRTGTLDNNEVISITIDKMNEVTKEIEPLINIHPVSLDIRSYLGFLSNLTF